MTKRDEIARAIRAGHRALLFAHVMPDGDTIGSVLGLAWGLRQLGLVARVACADPVPAELHFLPGVDEFAPRRPSDEDLIMILDASDLSRIGDLYDQERFAAALLINIDHHVTNTHFADLTWIEPRASTAELILDLLLQLDVRLDADIATCLLTGIVTDTRCFCTANTEPATLRAAIRLMDAGASLAQITDAVFSHRSMDVIRLWGPALCRAVLSDGVLWTEISQEMLRQANATLEASNGLVNFLSTMHEARAAAVFREMGDGTVDVSLRSKPGIDVSGVAFAFGGGGHAQAAGCQVVGELAEVRERIVRALQQEVRASLEAPERIRSVIERL
ncbi:MAG: DHH family phosphoesterase [Chloroflexi bacterium]|nr:DHH family phosphoesterase [Chloroflexota bacterium]